MSCEFISLQNILIKVEKYREEINYYIFCVKFKNGAVIIEKAKKNTVTADYKY